MPAQQVFGRRGLASPVALKRTHRADETPNPTNSLHASYFVRLLFGFDGRIPRMPYWLTGVGTYVGFRVVAVSAKGMSSWLNAHRAAHAVTAEMLVIAFGSLALLFGCLVGLIWINLAITVKRWHDRGKSWAWALLGFVPVIGWLWQFIECGFLEGTLGPNRFGPSPKGITGVTYGEPLAETFS